MSEPSLLTAPFKKSPEEWLLDQARRAIRKRLGADYDPEKLIVLLGKVCNEAPLTDDEVLDLAEMFIFFMEHELHWKLGVRMFKNFLGIDRPTNLNITEDSASILSSGSFCKAVCTSHWQILQAAVQARVLDTTGASFPRDKNTGAPKPGWVYDDQGGQISYESKPSPLRAGGTEVIFMETSTAVSSVEATELAAIFGAIGVVSQVTVKSTPDAEGNWTIEVLDWQTWAWDRGDFNGANAPNTQELPIRISDFFGPEWVQEQVLGYIEDRFGIKRSCLENFTGFDRYMRQLEDTTYRRKSVVTGEDVTYFPQFFLIFFSKWDFYASTAQCGPPRSWTIRQPQ